jgi:hypothetical protein
MQTPLYRRIFCATAVAIVLTGMHLASPAYAQSSCSSDKQAAPTALLERFIGADCDTCWATSTLTAAGKGQASLDWIVPSPRGDEAALSAAATNDAAARLQALKLPWTGAPSKLQTSALLGGPAGKAASTLRVAHGLPFNGYIGASIEFKPGAALRRDALKPKNLKTSSQSTSVSAYLILVEHIPAGAEGSDVERNLVRNVLVTPWDLAQQLAKPKQDGFKPTFESRPISIPQGVNPDRLRVLGWVEDAKGNLVAMAQSRCAP